MTQKVLPAGSVPDERLKYVMICVLYGSEWLFVRQKTRTTWEIPGGHIEPGEKPGQAAIRELYEESGLTGQTLTVLCDYYAEASQTDSAYGRVYLCRTIDAAHPPADFEMAEARLFDEMPSALSYPEIQGTIYRYAMENA